MAKKQKDEQPAAPGTAGPVPVHIGGESILDRLLPHFKKIMVGVAVIAVILGGFFGYRWWRDRTRAKETGDLVKSMEVLRADVTKPDPSTKPAPKAPPTYPTYKARAEAGLSQLAKTGGGDKLGNLYHAGLLLQAGRLDEAEKEYRASSTKKDLEGILAREGLGFVAEARAQAAKDATEQHKQLEAALAAFRAVQPDDKGPHRDHALYHEARILDMLQKKTEAIAALEKALEVAPETELEEQITARLALIEADKK